MKIWQVDLQYRTDVAKAMDAINWSVHFRCGFAKFNDEVWLRELTSSGDDNVWGCLNTHIKSKNPVEAMAVVGVTTAAAVFDKTA